MHHKLIHLDHIYTVMVWMSVSITIDKVKARSTACKILHCWGWSTYSYSSVCKAVRYILWRLLIVFAWGPIICRSESGLGCLINPITLFNGINVCSIIYIFYCFGSFFSIIYFYSFGSFLCFCYWKVLTLQKIKEKDRVIFT